MARISTLIFIIGVFVTEHGAASDMLCPKKPALQDGADDLRMHEEDFSFDRAHKSVHFLQTDFAGRIWGTEPVRDFSAWSGHYISYANSLMFIEGVLLKQQALLYRARLNELTESDPASFELSELKIKFAEAKNSFCKLLSDAKYVD